MQYFDNGNDTNNTLGGCQALLNIVYTNNLLSLKLLLSYLWISKRWGRDKITSWYTKMDKGISDWEKNMTKGQEKEMDYLFNKIRVSWCDSCLD